MADGRNNCRDKDSTYSSNPLPVGTFISVELIIMKRIFLVLDKVFSDSV